MALTASGAVFSIGQAELVCQAGAFVHCIVCVALAHLICFVDLLLCFRVRPPHIYYFFAAELVLCAFVLVTACASCIFAQIVRLPIVRACVDRVWA